jgi:hypothetical protein
VLSMKGSRSRDGDPQSQLPQPTKFQFQPQSHPPPPPPPLPEPQVKSFSNPRAPNHYQTTPAGQLQSVSNQDLHTFEYIHKGSPQHTQQDHTGQNGCSTKKGQHRNKLCHDNSSPLRCSSGSYPNHSHSKLESDKQRGFQQFRSLSPGTPTSGHDSTYPPSSRGSELDDHTPATYGDNKAPFVTVSEDEFESEEDISCNREARASISTSFVLGSGPTLSLPTFTRTDKTKDDVIQHMRQEIACLRRTSAEAVSTSIRLSEQLANAHFEVARCREATRELEEMLQDEAVKRRDAERLKEVEAERRRAAEQALSNMAIHSPGRLRPI